MTRYRVEFCRDWLLGRWGFTDRLFNKLGGKETEPSRLENAWLLNFKGNPRALGRFLSHELNIQKADFDRFGTIFEIQELTGPAEPETNPEPPPPAP
jgi:hypothetical protein